MISSTLRLFNAIQVKGKSKHKISDAVFKRTIKHGYILNPYIKPDAEVLDEIEKVIGISGEKANAAFHKSWSMIKDSPMEALVIQQLIHYFTTYGLEALGLYTKESVFIPNEVLKLPKIKSGISLTLVKAMSQKEILEGILTLASGVALSQETLDDIMTIIKANGYGEGIVEKIKNRELKAMLCDHFGSVPKDPVEFLRHLVSKLTNESLIIKNKYLIDKIKESNGKFLDHLLKDAPADLASIFFRFKPLFLAMKSISNKKKFFNRLRKKADKLHIPLPEDYLNIVTSQIKRGSLDLDKLFKRLGKASIFRKIRLAYALNYRLDSTGSIVYRVRNSKGWATEFDWSSKLKAKTKKAFTLVMDAITEDIKGNVKGKTIYIPKNVNYALPATEKQFIGQLPTGTWVSVPKDLIVGIHWQNVEGYRVDIDLSLVSPSGKIGWDEIYRSEEKDILFSGDVTDAPAPTGATELFHISGGLEEPQLLMANYYNFEKEHPVDCKVLAAHESPKNFGKNYMVNVSNIVCSSTVKIDKQQSVLGLIINIDGKNRVYFFKAQMGSFRSSSGNAWLDHARDYLIKSTVNPIDFRGILTKAGAVVVDKLPEGKFIDLSPANVSKETIIQMLQG